MIKKLKTWGSGLGIYFDKEEVENNKMNEGDLVDIADLIIKKGIKKLNDYKEKK